MSYPLDICICTRNRARYLEKALESVIPQMTGNAGLIIIDNGSNDMTISLLNRYRHLPGVKIFTENNPGLSMARNKAWKESGADYLMYIDDDCVAPGGFVDNAIKAALAAQADIIGGPVIPVFESEKHVWLPEKFGEFTMPYHSFSLICEGYVRGGCFMIKKSLLDKYNGFDTGLGMIDRRLRYAEEIALQMKARKDGYTIAYDPSLAINHTIRAEKISTLWLLRAEFARRRDKMKIEPKPLPQLTWRLALTMGKTVLRYPASILRSVIMKNYTYRQATLDSLKPLVYRLGEWWGVLRK